ncbi:MAG: hypothetical protein ABSG95_12645 [Solirubrobacteraceae bacterium]|jgi:hypothetical protein
MAAKLTSPVCADCGVNTTPYTGKRGCRHIGRWEDYMVRDEIWTAAGVGEGFLCVGCLELRLGRRLESGDFVDVPINEPDDPWHTPRLASRLRPS